MTDPSDDAVEIPLDGCLDLHTFHPRDLGDLVPDYLDACRERGILEIRIVHGKGQGQLRRSVESILARLDIVSSWRTGGPGEGSWGATMVRLHPLSGRSQP
ncbi:MAG: DNA mismatch repair protein MutS [Myxococcales bacterium]|nr:MAG: DNA mismatch repair protein MutS [Myxococcales bacterium]